jgi:hypothetical protein
MAKKKVTSILTPVGKPIYPKPPTVKPSAAPSLKPPGAPAAPGVPAYKPPVFTGDSSYWSDLGQIGATRQPLLDQLNQDDAYDTTSTNDYVTQLAKNSIDSQTHSMATAAKMGVADSGYNAKTVGDIAEGTRQQTVSATEALKNRMASRGIQRQGILAQYGDPSLGTWGAAGNSALSTANDRWLASREDAAANAPAAQTGVNTARPTSGNAAFPYVNSKTGEAYKDQVIGGVKYHVYSNGKKIKVS